MGWAGTLEKPAISCVFIAFIACGSVSAGKKIGSRLSCFLMVRAVVMVMALLGLASGARPGPCTALDARLRRYR